MKSHILTLCICVSEVLAFLVHPYMAQRKAYGIVHQRIQRPLHARLPRQALESLPANIQNCPNFKPCTAGDTSCCIIGKTQECFMACQLTDKVCLTQLYCCGPQQTPDQCLEDIVCQRPPPEGVICGLESTTDLIDGQQTADGNSVAEGQQLPVVGEQSGQQQINSALAQIATVAPVNIPAIDNNIQPEPVSVSDIPGAVGLGNVGQVENNMAVTTGVQIIAENVPQINVPNSDDVDDVFGNNNSIFSTPQISIPNSAVADVVVGNTNQVVNLNTPAPMLADATPAIVPVFSFAPITFESTVNPPIINNLINNFVNNPLTTTPPMLTPIIQNPVVNTPFNPVVNMPFNPVPVPTPNIVGPINGFVQPTTNTRVTAAKKPLLDLNAVDVVSLVESQNNNAANNRMADTSKRAQGATSQSKGSVEDLTGYLEKNPKASLNRGDILEQGQMLEGGCGFKTSVTLNMGKTITTEIEIDSINNSVARSQMKLQEDGNVVLYNRDDVALWSSNTFGTGVGPYTIKMTNRGSFNLYDRRVKRSRLARPLWGSKTRNPEAIFVVLQDGNMVVVVPTTQKILWSTDTAFGCNEDGTPGLPQGFSPLMKDM